ncbi:MAG: peroxidase-related enzyme [candidate division WOR-3 bacterium]|nr:peroxidase-related enzyme [candidate division WOR-3 bacterium]
MAWIKIIDENSAEGKLKEIYSDIAGKRGKLSNIMRVHSLSPLAMQKHIELYTAIMFDRCGLSRAEREMIGVAVSGINECRYCVAHHAEALNAYWKNRERIDDFINDFDSAGINARQKMMIEYACKLTENPGSVTEEMIDKLREAGLSDEEILSLNLTVSYFNFVNRIVKGLGVEMTEEETKGYKY